MNIAEAILTIDKFSIIKEDYSSISEKEEKLIMSEMFDFLREKGYFAKHASHILRKQINDN